MNDETKQYHELLDALKAEWKPIDGFFFQVGQGEFSYRDSQRVLAILRPIQCHESLPREVVTYLWYIPILLRDRRDFHFRLKGIEGENTRLYDDAMSQFDVEIERLLGVPDVDIE